MEITTSLLSHHHLSLTDILQISSLISPINTVASPPIKSRHVTSRRALLKRRRRTRRRSPPSLDDDSPFLGGDDGGTWNFGGGGGGGGGGNWSSRDDWFSADDNNNHDDPAFDFVFEIVCWIVFSNCVHFAFKKVFRLVSDDQEKVPIRIASVCLD